MTEAKAPDKNKSLYPYGQNTVSISCQRVSIKSETQADKS